MDTLSRTDRDAISTPHLSFEVETTIHNTMNLPQRCYQSLLRASQRASQNIFISKLEQPITFPVCNLSIPYLFKENVYYFLMK